VSRTTLPPVPGRDLTDMVEAAPSGWIGAEVWGTRGDTGVTRDGTHADMIAKPRLSFRQAQKGSATSECGFRA
jgi:NADPH:quinone reductase